MAGKRVLVTGGGSGLGREIAGGILRHGAAVYISGRREAVLIEAAETLGQETGGTITPLVCDIRQPTSIDAMLDRIWAAGPLAGLVNNAAANFIAPTKDLSPRGYEAVRSTVMDGSFYVTLACGKRCIAGGLPGSVVSNLATWVWTGSAYVLPSAMAKTAIHAMTMSLAVEWGPYGIRLNATAPGPFPTEGAWEKLNPIPEASTGATQSDKVPMRRYGRIPELQNLLIFLMSDACEYLTGQTIAIDGGHHLAGPATFRSGRVDGRTMGAGARSDPGCVGPRQSATDGGMSSPSVTLRRVPGYGAPTKSKRAAQRENVMVSIARGLTVSAFAVAAAALPAAGQQPRFSDNVVKIGVLNDRVGSNSDATGEGSAVAVRLAGEEFGGAIGGVPIEVVVGDHLNKPDVGVTIARRWLDNENVDVIADVASSGVGLAVNNLMAERKKIFLNNSASSDFTGKACQPLSVQWNYNAYANTNAIVTAVMQDGGHDTWFIIGPDYAFGYFQAVDVRQIVEARGGKVLGIVFHPAAGSDFSSYLLQAQASGAKVIALANSANDLVNTVKQAREFGIGTEGGPQSLLVVSAVNLPEIEALGLPVVHDLLFLSTFEWNLVRAKKPAESKEKGDFFHLVQTLPGDSAFLPLDQSACPLVRK